MVGVLPNTRDIWARDYMPVPVGCGRRIQFRYFPDYLRAKHWQRTISDGRAIAKKLGFCHEVSPLVVDGGNVVRGFGRVIMTGKVLRENPAIPPRQLIQQLAHLLEVARIDLIPAHPLDFTGHADGMVHVLDERTVLVNDYAREPHFAARVHSSLRRAGLQIVPLPYNPYQNRSNESAVGIYINLLRIGRNVLVPSYQLPEDERVLRTLEGVFPACGIVPIDGRALAREGGVFHCVTWASEIA